MEDPRERLTTSVSDAELERRWRAAREIMKMRKIDFLLMRNDEEFLGGYVRWFTDIPANHSYPFTVIFPCDEGMTTISCAGVPPAEPYPPPWAVRGVKNRLGAPYFASIHYTSDLDAELAVKVFKERKRATIGLVGKSFIPLSFYEYLRKHLPGYKFVDATDPIDQVKVIKSPEEIELIRHTAVTQDIAMEQVRKSIRPGRRDFEILAEADYSTTMQGSERQLVLVGSCPQDQPARWQFRRTQNRVIREGDQISVLIETNGPGGFYTELGRIFTLGKPSQALQDAFGAAVEAQDLNEKMMRPGADPKDIWEANNRFLQKKSFQPERRLYAHGQGYDLVERPAIRFDEPMKIRDNMNIAIHPSALSKAAWATVTNNYLVREQGDCLSIHKFPREIVEL